MQITNYTQLSNEFIEQMFKYDMAAIKVFVAISRKTIGWHKKSDKISYSQLKKMTGLCVNSLKKGIKVLIKDGWITQTNDIHDMGYIYDLNIITGDDVVETYTNKCELCGELVPILHDHHTPILKSDGGIKTIGICTTCHKKLHISKNDTVSKNDTGKPLSISKNDIDLYQPLIPQKKKETNKKERDLLGKQILEYLNDKANRKFKVVHTYTINALKTYSIENLKKIVDIKVKEWSNDNKMKKCLRQETLFRASHLDTYLTEAEEDESGSDISNW